MKSWYAVLGDPIAQSMSPVMHDQWFEEAGLHATYIPIHVQAETLEKAIVGLRTLGSGGWNVTVPHKQAIIPYLDEVDSSAERMEAVNTVYRTEGGRLIGANTDGRGFVKSLEEFTAQERVTGPVLVIGAGGAARGIAFALREAGYGPLYVTNRTVSKAEELASQMDGTQVISTEEAERRLGEFGLVVQTTSVGMNFAQAGMPLDPKAVAKNAVVADIIYNPLETAFLQTARLAGARTMNGVGMFVHQGALAFEKWTGIYPDTKKMIDTITMKVGG
ncbi:MULTISPECIES: shikimate dehydrogenase [unclassified Sporosarcina]|uniref:shikimate dehydrogenase n=1 Tax=unclassified Sporosarcina TaxID=2647733 RepID=UPI00203AF0D9|nr:MULTISPECIES: shikimate dehydrogenase [unclassified Sporosarcina]GKV66752.1 shikimate dehydrogenase (NADP(+)) [Sporosarcina sp. NCCP-2331]GLB57065.1 shikimate dehydrogenase (NADP(+)) [Sporosarcina sp. NCCP-2378]